MVHIAKKKIYNNTYLYIQKCVYNKGSNKTVHVAYLGREDKFTKEQIEDIIEKYNRLEAKKKNENK